MALVEVRNLRKRFGPVEVLKGVSLDVAEGEIVTIIGRSGSGKSTLLRCVNLLETVDDGLIRLDGADVTDPGVGLVPRPAAHAGRPRPRAMTMRCTSDVPSPISRILASR